MTIREYTAALAAGLAPLYPETEAAAIAALVIEHRLHLDALQRRMQAQGPVPAEMQAQLPFLLTRLLAHEPVPTSSTRRPGR